MLGLTKTILPRLAPRALQTSSHRTRYYQVPGENFIRLAPPDTGDPQLRVGPWPRTQEERERAAKKYNLIPEDYKPFDECEGFGDYPDLKAVGAFNRDPYEDFDDPTDNRMYNETLHRDYDLYLWERVDPLEHEKGHWPFWKKLLYFVGFFGGVPLLVGFMRENKITHNLDIKARKMFAQGGEHPILYEFPKVNT